MDATSTTIMKRILLYSLIFFITIGLFYPNSVINAQNAQFQCYQSNGFPIPLAAINTQQGCVSPNIWTNTPPSANFQALGAQAPQQVAPKEKESSDGCSSFISCVIGGAFSALAGKIIAPIFSAIFGLIQWLMSLWLGLAGIILNTVLKLTIIDMSSNISSMSGINIAWKTIKDVTNIVFIFLLVYEAILIILSISSVGEVRKLITNIVIAALLVNFSLFFTKVLIDASNVITIGVYEATVSSASGGNNSNPLQSTGYGLSGALTNVMGLQTWEAKKLDMTDVTGDYGPLVTHIMTSILYFITGFIFLAVSVMFVIRYIVLVILLALSPLAYLGTALPQLKSSSTKWWSSLRGQLLFPPAFMMMMWVALIIMSDKNFLLPNTSLSSGGTITTGNVTGAVNIFFNFALVIGMVITAMITSKQLATMGDAYIGKMINGTTKFAGNSLLGGTAWLGRRAGGSIAMGKSTKEELEARAAKGEWGARARLAVSRNSFDLRKVPGGGAAFESMGVNFGSGIPFNPKAGEGGRVAEIDQKKKDRESDMDTVMSGYVKKRDWNGLSTYLKTGKPAMMSDTEWTERKNYIYRKLSERDKQSLDKAIADPAMTKDLRKKISIDEKIKLYASDIDPATGDKDWKNFVTTLYDEEKTNGREDYVYEKLSSRDRADFEDALRDVRTASGTSPADIDTEINNLQRNLSNEDRDKTKEQIRKVKLQKAQDAIIDNIENHSSGGTLPAGISLENEMKKLNAKQARYLSARALTNTDVIENLSGQHLADIIANSDELDDTIKATIVGIANNPAATHPMAAKQRKYFSQPAASALWGIP